MPSQWQAIGNVGSDGRAFQRRVSDDVQLAPFDREQTGELVRHRIATSAATINVILKRAVKDLYRD